MGNDRISYKGFCALGGLKNPKCFTKPVYLGKHYMFTEYYYMTDYEPSKTTQENTLKKQKGV